MGMKFPKDVEEKILALAAMPADAGGSVSQPARRGWLALVVWVPHLPASEANKGGKRKAAIARKTATKAAARAELPTAPFDWPRPITVRLTRCGGKRLDRDNLGRALKEVQDEVARWLGVDDGDRTAVRWVYKQRPGWSAGVEIRIGGAI